jgi:hypothetical protein
LLNSRRRPDADLSGSTNKVRAASDLGLSCAYSKGDRSLGETRSCSSTMSTAIVRHDAFFNRCKTSYANAALRTSAHPTWAGIHSIIVGLAIRIRWIKPWNKVDVMCSIRDLVCLLCSCGPASHPVIDLCLRLHGFAFDQPRTIQTTTSNRHREASYNVLRLMP